MKYSPKDGYTYGIDGSFVPRSQWPAMLARNPDFNGFTYSFVIRRGRYVVETVGPFDTELECWNEMIAHYFRPSRKTLRESRKWGERLGPCSDLEELRKKYPGLKTPELCGHCGTEVEIPAYSPSRCPNCGKSILPCSMCEDPFICCDFCPFDTEPRS